MASDRSGPPDEPEAIYCKNCRHLKRDWLPPFVERCKHPKNWMLNWLRPTRRSPWDMNKNNNCKLFEKKKVLTIAQRYFGRSN